MRVGSGKTPSDPSRPAGPCGSRSFAWPPMTPAPRQERTPLVRPEGLNSASRLPASDSLRPGAAPRACDPAPPRPKDSPTSRPARRSRAPTSALRSFPLVVCRSPKIAHPAPEETRDNTIPSRQRVQLRNGGVSSHIGRRVCRGFHFSRTVHNSTPCLSFASPPSRRGAGHLAGRVTEAKRRCEARIGAESPKRHGCRRLRWDSRASISSG